MSSDAEGWFLPHPEPAELKEIDGVPKIPQVQDGLAECGSGLHQDDVEDTEEGLAECGSGRHGRDRENGWFCKGTICWNNRAGSG